MDPSTVQQIMDDDPVRRRRQPRTRQPSSSCPRRGACLGAQNGSRPPDRRVPPAPPAGQHRRDPHLWRRPRGRCSGRVLRRHPPIAPAPGGHRNRPGPGQHLENVDGQPFVGVAVTPNGDAAATEILHRSRPGRRREPGEWGRHDAHIQRGQRPTCPGDPPLRDPPGAGRIDSHAHCPRGAGPCRVAGCGDPGRSKPGGPAPSRPSHPVIPPRGTLRWRRPLICPPGAGHLHRRPARRGHGQGAGLAQASLRCEHRCQNHVRTVSGPSLPRIGGSIRAAMVEQRIIAASLLSDRMPDNT